MSELLRASVTGPWPTRLQHQAKALPFSQPTCLIGRFVMLKRTAVIVVALAIALTAAFAGALRRASAQSAAPEQNPAPAARGGQARGGGRSAYEPTLWLPDDQFLRWPFSDPQYKNIDGFRIKSYINEITGISRKSRDD